MAYRNILKIGDSTLNKISKEAKIDERLFSLLDDLKDTLEKADGLGLAAPQVGILRRVAIITDENDEIIELINPVIVKASGCVLDAEGCLSVPGRYGEVERPQNVTVGTYNRDGSYKEIDLADMIARAACHEIDHLDGKLFVDKVTRFLTDEEIKKSRD